MNAILSGAILIQTTDPVTKDLLQFFGFFLAVALVSLIVNILLDGK